MGNGLLLGLLLSPRDYLSKGKPVIPFLSPDPLILMLLLCESAFAVPGPLYFSMGLALCRYGKCHSCN